LTERSAWSRTVRSIESTIFNIAASLRTANRSLKMLETLMKEFDENQELIKTLMSNITELESDDRYRCSQTIARQIHLLSELYTLLIAECY